MAGAVFGVSKAAVSRRRDLLRPLTGAVLAGLVPGLHRGSGPYRLPGWRCRLPGRPAPRQRTIDLKGMGGRTRGLCLSEPALSVRTQNVKMIGKFGSGLFLFT